MCAITMLLMHVILEYAMTAESALRWCSSASDRDEFSARTL